MGVGLTGMVFWAIFEAESEDRMRYTDKEIDLLGFTLIGAEDAKDPDPPWNGGRITWKGKEIPFIDRLEISYSGAGPAKILIWVAPDRNYGSEEDKQNFQAIMREMKERDNDNIEIIGWPKPGDEE